MQRQQDRFASGRATGGEVGVSRIDCEPPQRIVCFSPLGNNHRQKSRPSHVKKQSSTNQDALRQIGLRNDHRTHRLYDLDENGIFRGGFEGSTDIAQGSVIALDIELVLHRDWDSMERSLDFAGSFEFAIKLPGLLQRIFEEDLGDTVGLSST